MVGGGQMGTGIAQVAAVAGQQVSQNLKIYSNLINGTSHMQVVISDLSEAQLTASKNSLKGGLARFATNIVIICIPR